MRIVVIILAWITPALIAGALGWSGIWGGGNALSDYLIPIPVAGGAMHVPGFAIAVMIIMTFGKLPKSTAIWVPRLGLAVFLIAVSMQLDMDRLTAYLFTDYVPAQSPIRFDGNAFLLFIATDALWVAIYAWLEGVRTPARYLALLPIIPIAIIGIQSFSYSVAGPQFEYGFTQPQEERGNVVAYVFASTAWDEQLFQDWMDSNNIVTMPWETPNAQNLAVYFSNSMQAVKWHKMDEADSIVGTLCYYEEDKSSTAHSGQYDCFADRLTFWKKMQQSFETTHTDFGSEIDRWLASASLCEGVDIPDKGSSDIEIISLCRGMKKQYPGLLDQIIEKHGEDSPHTNFLKSKAGLVGLDD